MSREKSPEVVYTTVKASRCCRHHRAGSRSHGIPSLDLLPIPHHNSKGVRSLLDPHIWEVHQKIVPEQFLHHPPLLRLHVPKVYRGRHIRALISGIARLGPWPFLIPFSTRDFIAVAAQEIGDVKEELVEDAVLLVAVAAELGSGPPVLVERVGKGEFLRVAVRAGS